MRVVVLGVGAVGEVIAKHLSADNKISLTVADLDENRLRRIKQILRTRKTEFIKVGNEPMENILANAELVINSATPNINIDLMKKCQKLGVNYMDLASSDIDRQLSMDKEWKRKEITAIVCMGEDPGLSNIYAKFAADQLDKVHSIAVRDGEYSTSKKYPLVALFSPEIFFEEIMSPSYVYVDGKYQKLPAFCGHEKYEFPSPIGTLPVYSVAHEEVFMLPRFIGKNVRYVDFKLALDDELVRTVKLLKRLGFFKAKKMKVKGHAVAPRDVFYALVPKPSEISKHIEGLAALLVEVVGENNGRKTTHRLYTYMSHRDADRLFGVNATAYLTGTVPAATASMMARGEISAKGVIVPEQLNPSAVIEEIAKKQVTTYVEVSEEGTLSKTGLVNKTGG